MDVERNLKEAGAYQEYDKWVRGMVITGCATAVVGILGFHLVVPLYWLIGMMDVSAAGAYFGDLVRSYPDAMRLYVVKWIVDEFNATGQPPLAWLIWLAVTPMTFVLGWGLNPHRNTPNIFGDARYANEQDIEAMGKRDLVGFDKKLFLVGRFKGKLIRMGETLSILLLAPPGCTPPGSEVRMADGTIKAVEDVVVGDLVRSPKADGTFEAVAVEKTLSFTERDLYRVEAEGGSAYRCSDNHLVSIAVQDESGRFHWQDVEAAQLHAEMLMMDEARSAALRVGVEMPDGSVKLQGFRISKAGRGPVHGFQLARGTRRYVGDGGIITHNTGKSVGFIVPSIVELDHCSMFCHDQKPELWDMCSGHRQLVGPCFQLKWSAEDEPDGKWLTDYEAKFWPEDMLAKDENGDYIRDPFSNKIKTKPVFYPSWNPLSPKCIPAPGPKRDLYIERLANVLCPDPKSGGDKFWTSKARSAINGMSGYLCAKVEAALDEDLGWSWDGIPDHVRGKEASFPMLVEWFAYAQNEIEDPGDDPMRVLFKNCIDECKKLNDLYYKKRKVRPLNRAIIEMTALMNSPDKTRGSILQTMDEALSAFKIESVRQRTSQSDFAFSDLRGIPNAEAKEREMKKVAAAKAKGVLYKPQYKPEEYRPVSVFISVNAEDAKAMAIITGIFCDAANSYLVANGPNATDDQGNQVGPFPFGFLMDECPQLPVLETVKSGPATGRSKKVFYILVGQDYGQFEEKYSKAEVETLKSTTAIKIVLSQNNENSAKTISESVGKFTFRKLSLSEKGDGKNFFDNLFKKKSKSESWEQTEFLKPSFLMSMPQDKHIVLVQNYMNRPIFCDTPKFFLDKKIAPKVFNLRSFEGPRPAAPMPVDMMAEAARRHCMHAEKETEVEDQRSALTDPRHVIIATPRDIQSLTRDPYNNLAALGKAYACVERDIKDEVGWIDPPPEEEIRTFTALKDLSEFVGKTRYFIFDRAALDELNARIADEGGAPLRADLAQFIKVRAEGANEHPPEDIYHLGYQGAACLDTPEDPSTVTPQYAVLWICEILTCILGVEYQKKLFERAGANTDDAAGAKAA